MIDLTNLIERLSAHAGRVGDADDIGLWSTLKDALCVVNLYDLALKEADQRRDPDAPGSEWPVPSTNGPFLLIMRDRLAAGGLYMRRFAKQTDALAVSTGYLADREEWLFEVAREIDLPSALHAYHWPEKREDIPEVAHDGARTAVHTNVTGSYSPDDGHIWTGSNSR
jgi:hypothetical protein